MTSDLGDRLRQFVGRPTGPPFRAWDPVNLPMIRHWCDAIGDANPVYTDPAAAAASRHGGIVAPPAMLQAWTMPGLKRAVLSPEQDVSGRLFGHLDASGFTSVVATNCEQEYLRYLRPGDHLTVTGVIESVSDEKRTALGTGHFVTWRNEFLTDDGEVVGRMRFRILKFRPPEVPAPPPDAAPARASRPRPAINEDNRFFWDGVARGELLVQRCSRCTALRHPPRPMCPRCRSLDWDVVRASGRGTVHSWVVPHHPLGPAFPAPYVVALVDLEEGTRLVTNLVDVAFEDVRVDMPVELRITNVHGDLWLPLFRPVPDPPEARVGAVLPELTVPITPTLIVAGAIASRDFQDVHHDEAMARERGTAGIFMNILTTNGLVGRFVTDWAGTDAVVRSIAIRLGAPNFAGDEMRLTGRVARAEHGTADVEIRGRNRLGDHVTGTVRVTI